jgi:membrane protein DedA with SNARE-associated domain
MNGLAYVEHLSYIGVFFTVAFSGYAIPIPEELILIFGGYLIAMGISNAFIMLAVSILGAIVGDSFIYYLSGHGSRFTHKYHDRVEKSHAGWYIRHMKNNPFWTIFFSRFIVGVRFLNPLVSGLLKVRWRTFLSATALSAAIYIPIIIFLGYFFSSEIETVVRVAESVRHLLILVLAAGSAVLIFFFITNLLEKWR